MTDINERLLQTGGPIIKLEIGERVRAKYLSGRYQPQTDFVTGAVKTFDDGTVREQLVLTVRRSGRDEDERIFMKPTAERALSKWLREHDQKMEAGGTITLTRLPDKAPKTKGMSGEQDYAVEFEPPTLQVRDIV